MGYMATKIMIIRHGEKPSDDGSIRGVDENGAHDPNELSVQGWRRAGALIRLFAPLNGTFAHPALATPGTIYACAPDDHAKSLRSQHTVTPLAEFLKLPVNLQFHKGHEDKLAQAVTATQGVVLIAWEHDAIPAIVAGIAGNGHTGPHKWPDPRFDLVWVLEHNAASGWTLAQAPQLVLPGDREDVVPLVKTGQA
jgi:broad specificity phosphatase PhoE